MEKVIKRSHLQGVETSGKWSRLITSFCYAVLSFTAVVMFHQGLLAFLSYKLGYTTHLSFVKVDSKPYENIYWSTNRVLFLYAFPPGLLLLITVLLISRMYLYTSKVIDKWFALSFWWCVCSILYVSSQMTIALVAYSFGREDMYQGIPVVINWFGFPLWFTLFLSLISLLINLVMGFFFFQFAMQFSPSRGAVFNYKKQAETIRLHYIYPLLILIPVGMVFSFPKTSFFFIVFLINGLIWIPGLIIKGRGGYANEARMERNEIRNIKPSGVLAVILFLIIIRVVLFIMDKYWY